MFFLAAGGDLGSMLVSLLPLLGMFAIMYFLILKPEKKRKETYRQMLTQLSVNDEIITKGGVIGKIIKLEEDYMVVETGPDRVRLRMVRDAIFSKVEKTEPTVKVERS